MNTMTINGYQTVISYHPDIQLFRGNSSDSMVAPTSMPRMLMAYVMRAGFP